MGIDLIECGYVVNEILTDKLSIKDPRFYRRKSGVFPVPLSIIRFDIGISPEIAFCLIFL